METLPLRVRVGIRDHWTNGTVQASLQTLSSTLGHDVVVNPEWPLLQASLGQHYTDTFTVPAGVAGAVRAWCTAMTELLSDDVNAAWTEALLDKLADPAGARSRLRIVFTVPKGGDVKTWWDKGQSAFVISMPDFPVADPMTFVHAHKGMLLSTFDGSHQPSVHTSQLEASRSRTPSLDGEPLEQWEGIKSESHSRDPVIECVPDARAIPSPDELLLLPPYHLIVRVGGENWIGIEGSHSPTLSFLADYLKKWCRTNHSLHTKPPSVEITLHQRAYGLSITYDRLTLLTATTYASEQRISPTIILCLIEGLLGYEKVYSDASSWTYRRDTRFKTAQ